MIEGYSNAKVEALINRASLEEQRWVWALLENFRTRFPQADHWTVNINPPDIRIGVRSTRSTRGRVAFSFYWSGGEVCCSLRGSANFRHQMEENGFDWEIRFSSYPLQSDVEDWFRAIGNVFEPGELPLEGVGHVPADYAIEDDDYEQEGDELMQSRDQGGASELNRILYGPPGTGKTYATINHALGVLDPQFLAENPGEDKGTRKRLKTRFDQLVKDERVRFVTFHQSFSYEDFVEGLRADTDGDSAQIEYRVEPGIFKQLCDDARTRDGQAESGIRDKARIWKISINGTGASATKTYCLQHGEARIGWGSTGDLRKSPEQGDYYQSLGSGDRGTLSYFAEQMVVGDILLCIHSADMIGAIGVVTSDYRYEERAPAGIIGDYQHVRSVSWLYRDINLSILPLNDGRQFTLKTVYAMNRFSWADLLSYLQQQGVQPVEQVPASTSERKPYVLIIDEINRGNVSRIFGELITLIEPSKREGAAEALSLKLPYSKKPFSVPDNVYLLGTMNTADRSLAGLDIALRRRFTFYEMPPRPELLDGVMVEGVVDVGQLLRVMNQRIAVLLGREHCLGHAYFMQLKDDPTLAQLELIFRNQVLPLLQEYFFEDWQRIAWVFNDHRKPSADQFVQRHAQDISLLFGSDVPVQDRVWHINSSAFSKLSAYAGVIKAKVEAGVSVAELEGLTP
ncbi:AAA family ATPase [Pseudomonas citronellolis]|uniref:AAA family ATPase n=1 Tax=Pseudomonas citronellolis TaxID=53408 RepID=UPI0023E4277A|nr:AAA family ATPase [Pseudomonas citronellolis]MDF3932204.1 AAA family ATPase [Pseudomonas citronellolis]